VCRSRHQAERVRRLGPREGKASRAERQRVSTEPRVQTVDSPHPRDSAPIIGAIEYNAKAWTDAEADLRKSIDAFPQQVDPVAVLRLSLALDQQTKYAEALKYANQAVDLTKEGTTAGKAARDEKDRLTKLSSGTAPGQNPAPK